MPTFDAEVLGSRVREMRARAGLTQAGLAEAAGITDETVSRIERGAYEPALSTMVALADALRVGLDALVGRVPSPTARPHASPILRRLAERASTLTPDAASALLRISMLLPQAPANPRRATAGRERGGASRKTPRVPMSKR